jgi:hypothetical protein
MSTTAYDYNLKELINEMQENKNPDNLRLAMNMLELLQFNIHHFLNNSIFNISYIYRNSLLLKTPFEHFSQRVRLKVYRNLFSEITLKNFITLRVLELMHEKFQLSYEFNKASYHNRTKFILLLENEPNELFFSQYDHTFYKILFDSKYRSILQEALPELIQEYNSQYNAKENINYLDIDTVIKPLDIVDEAGIIEHIYYNPHSYEFIKQSETASLLSDSFWADFLLRYKCTLVAHRNAKRIEEIFKDIINTHFKNDSSVMNQLIQTKSSSHMVIYFSETLKEELRNSLDLCILCYKNSCSEHKKKLKNMLGGKVVSSSRFKYLCGV